MSKTIQSTIEEEVLEYLDREFEISEGVRFSQHKLITRIMRFKNRAYPSKLTKQFRYKYWYDIISSRVGDEVKNIDIDTANIVAYSQNTKLDFPAVFITNIRLKEWLRDNNQADQLNEASEMFSADGNVVFIKKKGGYELFDPQNFYVINQTAKTLENTAVIERHQLTQTDLRKMKGVWENIDGVIENCKERSLSATKRTTTTSTSNPLYEIFIRNGEVSEAELFEAQGKEGGRKEHYLLAKIVVAGLKKGSKDNKYILYADKIGEMPYEEAHRGAYRGRWWREGLYESLFDNQVRANEIGNQLARGLEWASKAIFNSSDKLIVQNALTDLSNGDIIKSNDLRQVPLRMQGLDQLLADWNRNIQEADRISNSQEIVRGETTAGTPFKLGQLMDINAGKLFVILRQRLTVPYKRAFRKWILPEIIKDLRMQDIINITGDEEIVQRFREMMVDNWYINNLINIGPHNPEIAQTIKETKLREVGEKEASIKNVKKVWEGVLPRIGITITGENFNMTENLQTLAALVQIETDPTRRAWILDRIYDLKGLPAPPMMPQIPQQQQGQQQGGGQALKALTEGESPMEEPAL
ncbi:MAG: hypothetical protein PF549_02725 [Patescibacteria group bacterium]|jgi:hypothetical protein|nr:hypothetical protein [Patescibacteria group bacterium]